MAVRKISKSGKIIKEDIDLETMIKIEKQSLKCYRELQKLLQMIPYSFETDYADYNDIRHDIETGLTRIQNIYSTAKNKNRL